MGPQLHSHEVQDYLRAMSKPKHSFCQAAVTMSDLYTSKGGVYWNFVFGQASLVDGVGVFSFARYHPNGLGNPIGPIDEAGQRLLLLRSCKVLAHETTHILGLKHCVHHHCLMNGANHLTEFDGAPMFLCTVCLRKLLQAAPGDPTRRYHALLDWFRGHSFSDEFAWLEERLANMGQPVPAGPGCADAADSISEVVADCIEGSADQVVEDAEH